MAYAISIQHVSPRPIASVRERMAIRDVPALFRASLDQVYAAAKSHAIKLDGQNVFVYRVDSTSIAEVEFGVGVGERFAPVGRVSYSEVPSGDVATTTHWGDYGALGDAHDAVVSWCKGEQRSLTGTSWEVYGHWSDDPLNRRTDIYYLLGPAGAGE